MHSRYAVHNREKALIRETFSARVPLYSSAFEVSCNSLDIYLVYLFTLAPPLIAGNFVFPRPARVIEPMCVNQEAPHLPRGIVWIAFVTWNILPSLVYGSHIDFSKSLQSPARSRISRCKVPLNRRFSSCKYEPSCRRAWWVNFCISYFYFKLRIICTISCNIYNHV